MAKDLKLENNDLFIDSNTGDFSLTESDTQHVKDIINCYVGWYKEFPTIGVGVKRYLGRPGSFQVLKREIKLQLKSDNYRADNIKVIGSEIYVTGERVKN